MVAGRLVSMCAFTLWDSLGRIHKLRIQDAGLLVSTEAVQSAKLIRNLSERGCM